MSTKNICKHCRGRKELQVDMQVGKEAINVFLFWSFVYDI